VHVQVAADVGARDEPGQRAVARRPQLIVAISNFRRDEGRPSRA